MASEDHIPLFEVLSGETVLVRSYREEDASALYEAMVEARAYLRPWLDFAGAHRTVEEARSWIIHCMADWKLHRGIFVGIWERKTQAMLGGSWINPLNWDLGYFGFGYWLRPSAAGHGYMTEAIKLLTDYALTTWQAQRIEIRCDERNERSIGVARRLGFVQEGRLRNIERSSFDGRLRTMLIFAMIPKEDRTSLIQKKG